MLKLLDKRNPMTIRNNLVIATFAFALTACASAHILSDKGKDLSAVQAGATLGEVEGILGESPRTWTLPGGVTYRVYNYRAEPTAKSKVKAITFDVFLWGLPSLLDPRAETMERTGLVVRRAAQIAISFDDRDIVLGVFPDFHDFDEIPSDGQSKNVSTNPLR